jgi:hypothetical protein
MPALLRGVAHGSKGLQPAVREPAQGRQIQTEAATVFGKSEIQEANRSKCSSSRPAAIDAA